ncbi:MAG TPA: aldehyde dehydrogenase [Bacteroidales bacterium]|nr:aldehyde dehydrogenase [Bacteroidales bacterium]
MENFLIYVGGQFITTKSLLEVRNPFDNSLVATTYLAGKEELEIAISKAEDVKKLMKELPSYKRYSILMQISAGLIKKREHIAFILSSEAAKPMKYALGEVDRAIQTFIVAAEESKRLPSEHFSLDWTLAGNNKEAIVKYFPLGIVAGISPFNFPLNLAVHKIAPAIASGNAIILKPARSTPLTVLELAKIIDETDLPKGAVSIIPMDRIAGNQLVTDSRIAKLSFTGSPEVGWQMKHDAGKKKITLELGGNSGVIITETANIENAISKCVSGAFAYSGQVCIHTQRIYVHEKIFDDFLVKFIEQTRKLKSGSPTDKDTDFTSMIDEENAIRVENWINEAIELGAILLHGGKRKGTYVEPTILTNTKHEMKVCSLEIFGPVVIIEKYNDFKSIIEIINNSEFGLQAGIFTDSIDEMNYGYENIEAGGVIINDIPTFRVDHMPYGGIKNSGFGREGVKYAILEMMEPKLLVKNK